MRVGAVFPQREIGTDPGAIRELAQAVRELGYHHLVVFDRGVAADIPGQPRSREMFHEPFVLLGFIAACAEGLELAEAVTVLPLRQTILVAKQAAEIDVLTRGRSRLGVGIGRNAVEFTAFGQSYADRTARIAEQIAVLRKLFTEELVEHRGRLAHPGPRGDQPATGAAPDPDLDGRDSGAVGAAGR